ncbi:MAG: thiamine pyrophosphate-dependent enzyme [Planctomycetota bacterium]
MLKNLDKYIRPESFPTPFCTGCGHGILMGAILRAIDELELDIDRMVFVSGIGCAAWIPSPHFAADTIHTTHGRPVAFATGIKLFNPKLKVVVVSGDGDLSAIGGNHLIHAARRNINLTIICANNNIYGMTGGQLAPTTPIGARTSTTPAGSSEPPFDLCKLVLGASSSDNAYVARTTVWHTRELIKYLKKAFSVPGFSFLEVISPCYTHFGRRNKYASPAEMILDLKDSAVRTKKQEDLFTFKEKNKILIGEFSG